jgi:hypothetical protein
MLCRLPTTYNNCTFLSSTCPLVLNSAPSGHVHRSDDTVGLPAFPRLPPPVPSSTLAGPRANARLPKHAFGERECGSCRAVLCWHSVTGIVSSSHHSAVTGECRMGARENAVHATSTMRSVPCGVSLPTQLRLAAFTQPYPLPTSHRAR